MTSLRNIATLIVSVFGAVAQATTINVLRDGTGDYATIQPALDAAADGDTILIGPGEYTEATSVRLPGWAYNIESYAHLRCDNLTIIGAGADDTIIGPVTYQGNVETGSPASLSYSVGGGSLRISDVGFRHCYAMFVVGIVCMERCRFSNNDVGLSWDQSGPGGWIRDSVFEVTEPIFDAMSFQIGGGGWVSGVLLERCQFGRVASMHSVQGIEMRDCVFHGLGLYAATNASIVRCESAGSNVAISQSMGGSVCSVVDCDLAGQTSAVAVTGDAAGGRFIVESSRLAGGTSSVVYLGRYAGSCEIHNCDFAIGGGVVARCEAVGPYVTHDLRNNYWGTTDEATIQSRIIDRNDAPNIGATVLYSPFAGQSLPTETTTWGALQLQFR